MPPDELTPEQYARVTQRFLELRELPLAQARAALAGSAEEPLVARETLALLEAQQQRRTGGDLSALGEAIGGRAREVLQPEGDERLPETIGPYRILARLGRGGMGWVYLGRRGDEGPPAAIKTLRLSVDSPQLRARFERELRVLRRLSHPGIAAPLDAGTEVGPHDTVPWFAMEFVEGEDLLTHVRRRALPLEQRLELFAQVCDAIHYAHDQGVVHRDLKPGNLMITTDGRPKVLDFGVARLVQAEVEETAVTQTGDVFGTPFYMSPEQTEDAKRADVRSDVYSLGVVLYEMLSGRSPYGEDLPTGAELARVVRERPARPLARALPGVARELQVIVGRTLEKPPAWRPQSAAALADALRAFVAGRRSGWRPVSRWRRVLHGLRTRPLRSVLLVLVVALAVLGLRAWRTALVRRDERVGRVLLEEARGALPDEPRRALALALAAVERAPGLEARSTLHQALLADRLRAALPGPQDGGSARALVLDPAGARAVVLWESGAGALIDVETRTVLRSVPGRDAAAFSPDGRRLATVVVEGGSVGRLLEPGSPTAPTALTPPPEAARRRMGHRLAGGACAFSPSGERLLVMADDGWLHLFDGRTGAWLATPDDGARVVAAAFSTDGRWLLAAGDDGRLRVHDAEDGATVTARSVTAGALQGLSVDPRGGRIAVGDATGVVHLLALDHGPDGRPSLRELERDASLHQAPARLRHAPDGRVLLGLDVQGTAAVWKGDDLTLLENFVPGASSAAPDLVFDRAGGRYACSGRSGQVRVRALRGDDEEIVLRGAGSGVVGLAFAPDGHTLLSTAADGQVLFWDVRPAPRLFDPQRGESCPWPDVFATSHGRRLLARPDPVAAATVTARDAADGAARWSLPPPSRPVIDLVADLAGRRLATLLDDGTVSVWDAEGGELLLRRNAGPLVDSVGLDPLGRWVAVGGRTAIDLLPVTPAGEALHLESDPDRDGHARRALAFSADGSRLAVGADDGLVQVRSPGARGEPSALQAQHGAVRAVALSGDGGLLLAGGDDGTARLLRVDDGRPLGCWDPDGSAVVTVLLSPDGRRVALGTAGGTFEVLDRDPDAERLVCRRPAPVASLAKLPGDGPLLAAWADGVALLLEADDRLREVPLQGAFRTAALLSGEHGPLLASFAGPSDPILRDGASGATLERLLGHHGRDLSVTVSADGQCLLTACEDGTLRCWDGRSDVSRASFGFPDGVDGAALDARGAHALVWSHAQGWGGGNLLGGWTVGAPGGPAGPRPWPEVQTGWLGDDGRGLLLCPPFVTGRDTGRLLPVEADGAPAGPGVDVALPLVVTSLGVAPGHWLCAGGPDALVVIDLDGPTPGPDRVLFDDFVDAVAASPDGRWLAALTGGRLVLFDAASGTPWSSLPAPAGAGADTPAACAVAFSDDGRRLLFVDADGRRRELPVDPLPAARARPLPVLDPAWLANLEARAR